MESGSKCGKRNTADLYHVLSVDTAAYCVQQRIAFSGKRSCVQCHRTVAVSDLFCGVEMCSAVYHGSGTDRLVFPCPEKAHLQGTRRGSGDLHDRFCGFFIKGV